MGIDFTELVCKDLRGGVDTMISKGGLIDERSKGALSSHGLAAEFMYRLFISVILR